MLQAGLVELVQPTKPQISTTASSSSRAARQQRAATSETPAARRSVVERLINRIRGL
jgi:hypothetical protein